MAYSSPVRYRSGGSPIRGLDQRFSSRPLAPILQEPRQAFLTRTLLMENDSLNEQNQRLIIGQEQTRGKAILFQRQLQIKNQQITCLNRDIRMLRDKYQREISDLRQQNRSLLNKNILLQERNVSDMQVLRNKYLNVTIQQTNLVKKGMENDIHRLLTELQTVKLLLDEKEKEIAHLSLVGHRNSSEYSSNLQSLISQNNILRNRLMEFEMIKNKELHEVENKKELQRSRTVGIMSYCKENNFFIEKEITRLAEQLLEKNISIQSFTKELLKQRKQLEQTQKRYEEYLAKTKENHQTQIKEKDNTIEKIERYYKSELAEQKKAEVGLQQQISSKQHQLQSIARQLNYFKDQISLKDKEIEELKESISKMHEDHSKQLSKVMINSRVKKSGINMSSYSSGSFDNIEDGQGSSIIKSGRIQRQLSLSNEGSGSARLPTVKQELAASHGHLDEQDDEDIEIKELIMHYESMIDEIKKNKSLELDIANQKIEGLKGNLNDKQQQILDILNRFSPLMQYKLSPANIQQQRKQKIEQHYKADLDLLSVMLDKYQIVALKKK